jgi:enoyl-CoA hydratase/carnithine racemase
LPKDFLLPERVDDFWRRAKKEPIDHAPFGGHARPRMLAAADTAMQRSLAFLKSISAFTVAACEGEVDFDLLGLLLACRYRICAADTTFANRTLSRKLAPGSGTPWFLTRLLGYAKARRIYLDGASLSADQAFEMGIVDRISLPEDIEQDGLAVAQRIAGYDRAALKSVMRAMELVDLDFATFIEQGGTGFGALPGSRPLR